MTAKQAIVRLREAALRVISVYPYDYKRCLRDRRRLGKSCRNCTAIEELAKAAKGVKV